MPRDSTKERGEGDYIGQHERKMNIGKFVTCPNCELCRKDRAQHKKNNVSFDAFRPHLVAAAKLDVRYRCGGCKKTACTYVILKNHLRKCKAYKMMLALQPQKRKATSQAPTAHDSNGQVKRRRRDDTAQTDAAIPLMPTPFSNGAMAYQNLPIASADPEATSYAFARPFHMPEGLRPDSGNIDPALTNGSFDSFLEPTDERQPLQGDSYGCLWCPQTDHGSDTCPKLLIE